MIPPVVAQPTPLAGPHDIRTLPARRRRAPLVGVLGAIVTSVLATLVGALAMVSAACGNGDHTAAEGGTAADGDAASPASDLCDLDAFTGSGMPCPIASPVVCFPECEAGGCSCTETASGPRWSCVTDLSCTAPCAPIDDACAATEDAGSAAGEDARSDSE